MPVVGKLLPTLMRSGCMWVMGKQEPSGSEDTESVFEERYLLPKASQLVRQIVVTAKEFSRLDLQMHLNLVAVVVGRRCCYCC